jgi:FkbM family methyltransferase
MPSPRAVARELMPHGLVETLRWQRRFARTGMNSKRSWAAALDNSMRHALVRSHLELIPARQTNGTLGCVVDVGLNEGQWLSALLSLVRVSRVDAFEPNYAVIGHARRRLRQWSVSIHPLALGSRRGTADFYMTEGSDFASLRVPRPELTSYYGSSANVVQTLEVPIRRLDDVFPTDLNVDILKIDVQGGEREVLAGAIQTLGRTSVLVIEANFLSHYEGDDDLPSLFSLLTAKYGFTFWNMAPGISHGTRALWADAIFVNLPLLHYDPPAVPRC